MGAKLFNHKLCSALMALGWSVGTHALTSFQLHNINEVHAQGWTGSGVTIAIVDTMFVENPDLLKGQFVANMGSDNYAKYYPNSKVKEHGNHVAGIAAGNKTNGESYGVAYNSKMVGFGDFGLGLQRGGAWNYNDLYKSRNYNVKVINNSHMNNYVGIYKDLINTNDTLIIYSAGNSNQGTPIANGKHGTGSANNLGAWLVVGNVNSEKVKRDANGKLTIDLSALDTGTHLCAGATAYCVFAAGQNIYSSGIGRYTKMSGTSMAAPLVTGVAALLNEKFPFLGGKQIADLILSTANSNLEVTGTSKKAIKDYDKSKQEDFFGQGIVDAEKAMKGLAEIDINRLTAGDVQNVDGVNVAFWTLNTKGHDTLFENDIDQKKWDNKYHASVNTTNQAALKDLNAGFRKRGAGTLSLSGNLNYLGTTLVEEGEIILTGGENQQIAAQVRSAGVQTLSVRASSVQTLSAAQALAVTAAPVLSVAGDLQTETAGTLSVQTNVAAAQDVINAGTLNVGTDNAPQHLSVAGEVRNSGEINIGLNPPTTRAITATTFKQTAGATLNAGYLDIGNANAVNNAVSATNYDVTGGTVTYTPMSASAISRTIPLALNGLENHLAAANVVLLSNNAHAVTYRLSANNAALIVDAVPQIYADYEGGNESMAKVLRPMSAADISPDYIAFFTGLNKTPDFDLYQETLKTLDDSTHLSAHELILATQATDILEKVLNLEEGTSGIFLKPRFSYLHGQGLKAHRKDLEFYANHAGTWGAFSAFANYDHLHADKFQADLVQLGAGLRNTTMPVGIFGGIRAGFARNDVQSAQGRLKYNAFLASLFAGVDKDFVVGETRLIPSAYLAYHLLRQSQFHTQGLTYNGSPLFNNLPHSGVAYGGGTLFQRQIRARNPHFFSANVGLTFKRLIGESPWRFNAHAFYERRLWANTISSNSRFVDFGTQQWSQKLQLAEDLIRLGFDLSFEPFKDYGFYAVLGLDYEKSLNAEKYKAYSMDLKLGYKF